MRSALYLLLLLTLTACARPAAVPGYLAGSQHLWVDLPQDRRIATEQQLVSQHNGQPLLLLLQNALVEQLRASGRFVTVQPFGPADFRLVTRLQSSRFAWENNNPTVGIGIGLGTGVLGSGGGIGAGIGVAQDFPTGAADALCVGVLVEGQLLKGDGPPVAVDRTSGRACRKQAAQAPDMVRLQQALAAEAIQQAAKTLSTALAARLR
jgi:hypothetical protein